MNLPEIRHYGAWRSAISAAAIASSAIGLDQLRVVGEDLYWIESRPAEGGRCVIVRRTAGGILADLTPPPWNVRSRVHEYGGGAYFVDGGLLCFVDHADQRVYLLEADGQPFPLTPEGTGMRYADLMPDRKRRRILAVREDHSRPGQEALNSIVALPAAGRHPGRILVSGKDFYSSPCISPDGTRIAWIAWNHPNMPWDATELWVGNLDADGTLRESRCLAAGESIQQPNWSPGGELYVISDRTGWWNLYRCRGSCLEALCNEPFDFARPPWVFGQPTYDFLSDTQLACSYFERGLARLGILDLAGSRLAAPGDGVHRHRFAAGLERPGGLPGGLPVASDVGSLAGSAHRRNRAAPGVVFDKAGSAVGIRAGNPGVSDRRWRIGACLFLSAEESALPGSRRARLLRSWSKAMAGPPAPRRHG